MRKRTFDAIVAVSKNYGIGFKGKPRLECILIFKGQIPWRLRKDLNHFKNVTTRYGLNTLDPQQKNVVIMGRKTWESLPEKSRPLPDRINIVLSSNPKLLNDYKHHEDNLYLCNSLDNSIAFVEQELGKRAGNIFLIGGSKVYEEGLSHPNCKEVFLTKLGIDFECDTFLSKELLTNYQHLETSISHAENNIPYYFQRYIQKNHFTEGVNKNFFPQKHEEFQYLEMIEDIIKSGNDKTDRTGTGTYSKFGKMMRYNLEETFPLLTTKDVFWRGVVEELLWFIRGDTDSNNLTKKKIHIWDANGSREFLDKLGFKDREVGDLGPVYGFQWRHFGAKYINKDTDYTGQGVDQLQQIIETLKKDPDNRRMIMTAWNPADLHLMALPPCHSFSQFYVADGKLSCLMYQRSCDMGLGVPFNIASYSLLCCMIAQVNCALVLISILGLWIKER